MFNITLDNGKSKKVDSLPLALAYLAKRYSHVRLDARLTYTVNSMYVTWFFIYVNSKVVGSMYEYASATVCKECANLCSTAIMFP